MQTHAVALETSWGAMYHDLIAEGLTLVRRPVALRTQTKNANREAHMFAPTARNYPMQMRVSYHGTHVLATKSKTVLEAMCDVTGTDYAAADYRLPIPDKWFDGLEVWTDKWRASGKPLLVYRPLVSRPEWRGSAARNADPVCYAELFATIRDHFFVISVADLAPGQEWIVGPQLRADVALHSGELTFEAMAALFSLADLVYTSSGFAAILAPAVGTPVVSVVGGYESAICHSSGQRFAPMLNIEPETPCSCWSSQCRVTCDKRIDMPKATARLREFVSETCIQTQDSYVIQTPFEKMFAPEAGQTPATPFPAPHHASPAYQLWLQTQRSAARRIGGGLKA
jgi:hypothetical protein